MLRNRKKRVLELSYEISICKSSLSLPRNSTKWISKINALEMEVESVTSAYILSNNDDMPPRLLALEVGLAQELRGQQGNPILHKFSTVVI